MISAKKIQKMKQENNKITCLTAYDCYTAKFIDEAGIDIVLVGDSLGQVVLGYDSTTSVSMEEMKVFTRAVSNGVKNALVVTDMPFLSYTTGIFEALKNAGELIKSGAKAVKIEGGSEYIIDCIKHMVDSGVPVMGHLGFTPQFINTIGGNLIQGKNLENTLEILKTAKKLQEAGVFSIVLEMVPDVCAKYIAKNLEIPVIGIGAGAEVDGQILVINDVVGKFDKFTPKFARKYVDAKEIITSSTKQYIEDVKNKNFPNKYESFQLSEVEYEKFKNYTQN